MCSFRSDAPGSDEARAYAISYAGRFRPLSRERAEGLRETVEQAVREGRLLGGGVELRKNKNGYRLSELSFEYDWGRPPTP